MNNGGDIKLAEQYDDDDDDDNDNERSVALSL